MTLFDVLCIAIAVSTVIACGIALIQYWLDQRRYVVKARLDAEAGGAWIDTLLDQAVQIDPLAVGVLLEQDLPRPQFVEALLDIVDFES